VIAPIYGLAKVRLTLYQPTGENLTRLTLQSPTREGLELSFSPEGTAHELGSGAMFQKLWVERGARPALDLKWEVGLSTAMETWTGSAWGVPISIDTAEALVRVFEAAFQRPALVEPHRDSSFSFLAQPDPQKALEIRDVKGVRHIKLSLRLVGTRVGSLPNWGPA
jgi:hypothetical protein